MRTAELSRPALGDLQSIQDYFILDLGRPDLSERFEASLRRTLEQLTQTPEIGLAWPGAEPRLRTLRRWFVDGFPNHIIFYQSDPDRVVVLAIFHGAMDLPRRMRDRTD